MQSENWKTDETLVLQLQSGDKKALPKLVKRWHKAFCDKAFWITKNKEIAKDIAQESWKTIIYKIDTLKEARSFGHWALRIVYTKSLDYLRQQNIKRLKEAEFSKSQSTLVEDYTEDNKLKEALLKAIKRLPDEQQRVIRLFYTENYSLIEISKLLNISIGTAKSRLFHAREKLKITLKNKNYEN